MQVDKERMYSDLELGETRQYEMFNSGRNFHIVHELPENNLNVVSFHLFLFFRLKVS